MKLPQLFFDKYGLLREGWYYLILVTAVISIVAFATSICAITSTSDDKQTNLKARCESAGGIVGADECYKNGEVLFNIGG